MKRIDEGKKLVVYQSKDGGLVLSARLERDSVWLTQAQIAELFNTERSVITKHLNDIFKSLELDEKSNVQKMHITGSDKPVKYYSLDAIISVGYRVNSKKATQFRIWATRILRGHLQKGYTVNQNTIYFATKVWSSFHSSETTPDPLIFSSNMTTKNLQEGRTVRL